MVEKESYHFPNMENNPFVEKGLNEKCLKRGMKLRIGMHTIIIPGY